MGVTYIYIYVHIYMGAQKHYVWSRSHSEGNNKRLPFSSLAFTGGSKAILSPINPKPYRPETLDPTP